MLTERENTTQGRADVHDIRRTLVALVDDDPAVVALVERILAPCGYLIHGFPDAESFLSASGRILPDVICLDLHLPRMSGLAALKRIRHVSPHLPVVMLTADSQVDTVLAAIQDGAYDYVTKPIDQARLRTSVKNAVQHALVTARSSAAEASSGEDGYFGLIGRAPCMRSLYHAIERVAESDVTVLITGESGTGKELVARAIHARSERRRHEFVALNCGAIPESLLESELFGHERGAFTGATARRAGRFEQADGGTLFLDEVAELNPAMQTKLLRVLQERTFQRLGSGIEVRSDFRVIAATNRDLAQEVVAGRFREDLFFRLAVFDVTVPPLRDRLEDIPLLAWTLMRRFVRDNRMTAPELYLLPDTIEALKRYGWPGNVRELSNAVQRAALSAGTRPIGVGDLPPRVFTPATGEGRSTSLPADSASGAPATALAALERQAIETALLRHRGNVSKVVRELGIGRTTLYRKLKTYELQITRG